MKKFDEVKQEVESNSTKFQTVISDIETKRIDLQRLELEIETITVEIKPMIIGFGPSLTNESILTISPIAAIATIMSILDATDKV